MQDNKHPSQRPYGREALNLCPWSTGLQGYRQRGRWPIAMAWYRRKVDRGVLSAGHSPCRGCAATGGKACRPPAHQDCAAGPHPWVVLQDGLHLGNGVCLRRRVAKSDQGDAKPSGQHETEQDEQEASHTSIVKPTRTVLSI